MQKNCVRDERRSARSRVRGRSDKYLTSPPEGATISREIHYRVVHSRRRLQSKFQSNWAPSFVLTAFGNGSVHGFYKNEKRAISVGDSILVLEGISRSEI